MSFPVQLTSTAYRLPRADIDTDMIIPARYLTITDMDGLREGCFADWRASDPEHPFNDPEQQGSQILFVGPNFGCGSSREHAAWALKQNGIMAIAGTEFADIFRGNAQKNGILLIELPAETMQTLMRQPVEEHYTIDLDRHVLTSEDGLHVEFQITDFYKQRLLTGMSDLDYLLEQRDAILAKQSERSDRIPHLKPLS